MHQLTALSVQIDLLVLLFKQASAILFLCFKYTKVTKMDLLLTKFLFCHCLC